MGRGGIGAGGEKFNSHQIAMPNLLHRYIAA
jgi:hypothetical protein